MRRWCAIAIVLVLAPIAQAADVLLEDRDGGQYPIGQLEWLPDKRYRLTIDYRSFKDFFLSMKEMKCLEGSEELWCHIPYPYDQPRVWHEDDYRWLSQDLLFMYKRPGEFGANFWQGVYYVFQNDQGQLRGTAMHVDLNALAAPPADLTQPFFDEQWLEPIDPAAHWLPTLVIR